MKLPPLLLSSICAVSLSLPCVGHATDKKMEKGIESLDKAAAAYREVVNLKDRTVPESVARKAECVAIFPEVVTAALVVGGTHGDGVALCKTASGEWGAPMFLDLTGASVGLQAGGKTSSIISYVMDSKTKEKLKAGTLKFGGDVSAVAGSFEKSFDIPSSGVVSFAHTKGAFLGASLNGVSVSIDKDEQSEFYAGQKNVETIAQANLQGDRLNKVEQLKKLLS